MKEFLRSTWEEIDKGNLLRMVIMGLILALIIAGVFYLSLPKNGCLPPSNNGTLPDYHMGIPNG